MQIQLIPGWILYNPTFKSYIIENEISEEVSQEIQPKNGKVARAHGLLKWPYSDG